MFSYSLVLLGIGTFDSPPPPEFIGGAASRIYHSAPVGIDRSQPKKSDGGAAEGSTLETEYTLGKSCSVVLCNSSPYRQYSRNNRQCTQIREN